MSRRVFLRRCVIASAVATTLGTTYCVAVEPTWVDVTHLRMSLRGLGASFEGYRLVQISDLHCGSSVPMIYLWRCMDRVNELQPDLVVVTGDLVSRGERAFPERAAALLSRLQAADGVVAILGNHDHGHAAPDTPGDTWWVGRITQSVMARGHRVLRNESIRISRGEAGLRIVGLDDCWARAFDVPKAFAQVDGLDPVVALTHNPDTFERLCDTEAQWILAGHTHGGQIKIPLLGPPFVPIRNKAFVAGKYQMNDRHFYVNRGLGWLRRARLNARPEITLFELGRA